jgi:serine/tyrosine/threonine adenylyltransferase
MTFHFPFENTYARLPERFFARISPTPVAAPKLVRLNEELARDLRLDPEWLKGPEAVDVLAGKRVPEGADPIATAYAGHQFGHFVPQLGDGRAILLGEVVDRSGRRRDIQLKGSGPTPFSRRGDGRAALGPVLREYLISEAMGALGIPTTRALAAVLTGEAVVRETLLPGAVLTRVASSHIRVGTFQFFAARRDVDGLRLLADHVTARHYPDLANAEQPYRALLDAVVSRQAELVARWLHIGFIHGVMNTDNMSIAGETIDYGPCAFMNAYDPATVFSSIDHHGRYAYGNQPRIANWNLARLAEALLPLLDENEEAALAQAQESIGAFPARFESAFHAGMRKKLGIATGREGDQALAQELLNSMAANEADFTLTFRRLCDAAAEPDADAQVRDLFSEPAAYDAWASRWRERLGVEPIEPRARGEMMRSVNPAFIPRNHRVEAVIEAAIERDDLAPFEELLAVIAKPYDDHPAFEHYAQPPASPDRGYRTFCGT